jgi:hypothetical protein
MKFILAATASALMLATGVAPTVAMAQSGPNVATLMPIDESRYDLANKKSVEKSDILNRLTKETYFREVFQVTGKPDVAFIVRETKPKMVQDQEEVFVRVNKVPQANTPGWSYMNR